MSDEELQALDESTKERLLAIQEELIQLNSIQLNDLIRNCNIRPQFAKTYRVLRRDRRDTLAKLRSIANNASPNSFEERVTWGQLGIYDNVISYKLERIASHFSSTWGEDIEEWAGPEGSLADRSGCLVLLCYGGAGVATIAVGGYLLV
jgi:hypothetical protein